VDCNGSYAANLNPSTTQQQWILTFTASNSSGQSATAIQTLIQLGPAAPTASTGFAPSTNWSGYVVPSNNSVVTETSGAWTVPTLNCAATPNGGSSIWVGIGGWASTGGDVGTLLQTGIEADCVNGAQRNDGWWEEYPSTPNQSYLFFNFPVAAGDSIQASVYQAAGGAWVTRVDDLTTGLAGVMVTGGGWGVGPDTATSVPFQGRTTNLSYSGGYSAEWIVEAYTNYDTQVALANYGAVSFSNLQTSLQPWYLTPSEGVELVQSGVVVSTPSLPDGNGFSVSYTAR
jgi:hypothetical protein